MLPNQFEEFESALLGSSFNDDNFVAVKAEDLESDSGYDFSKHFFEPQPGKSYLVKFLPNPGGDLITHRALYRSLPDPDRKGQTFRYVSSGNAKTCPVLQLFFDLHEKKQNGDAVAAKKIENYLSRSQQACVKVQILNSSIKEEIGQIRLFTFSTFGPNAHIANLINSKLNPSKSQIEAGFEREDIFNIFESPVLSIECTEEVYQGRKGRDFSKSIWTPKKRGAIVLHEDGSIYEFKKSDNVDGKLTPEAQEEFKQFIEVFKNPDYDVNVHFAYRPLESIPESDINYEYAKLVQSKLERIIPVIRDCSLTEIANFGTEAKSDSNSSDSSKNTSILEDSIPDELMDIVDNNEAKAESSSTSKEIDDLLS